RRDEIVLQPLGRHDREERGRGAGAERGREGTHPGGDELGTVLPARCSCHPAVHGASTHAPTYAKVRTRHPPKVGLTRRPVRLSFWTKPDLDKNTARLARVPRPVRAVSTLRLRRGNRGASSRMTCSHSVLRNASRLTPSNQPLRLLAPPLKWSILRAS